MTNKDNIPYTLFAKFFSGEISEKEQNTLDEFISEHPENEKVFNDYEIIWSTETKGDSFEKKIESALQSVKAKIGKQGKIIPMNNNRIWLRVAAAVIIIFGISFLLNDTIFNSNTQFVSIESGEKIKEYKLSDGSIVWLNKNSKIEFPEIFTDNKRIVKMTGEAYFIVSHNPEKPFVVETEHTTTEVLGTEFNLKAFENEQEIEIVLNKGKVKFTDTKSNETEIMDVNEKITLNKKERKLQKETVENANFLSWKTHELDLYNMNLEEIAEVLSNHYDIKVKADDSVKDKIFNSSIPFKDVNSDYIINTVKLTIGVEIDSVNDEIIFKK